MESLSLRETMRYHRSLVLVLFLLEIPLFIVSLKIFSVFRFSGQGDWDVTPIICIAIVDFILHFILYIGYGIFSEMKIHMPMVIPQLAISSICVPFMVDEFFHTSFILSTIAIWIGSCILFQTIIFGAFTAAISLFDRHTSLQEWKKSILSFISAISVGIIVSWALWMSMEKLYFYMRAH